MVLTFDKGSGFLCVLPEKRLAKTAFALLGLELNLGELPENGSSEATLLRVAGAASAQKQPEFLNRVYRTAKGYTLNLRKPL